MLALCRSRDIRELILWGATNSQQDKYDVTERILDHVWGSELSTSSVTVGTGPGGSITADLKYALRDYVEVIPSANVAKFTGTFNTSFRDQYYGGNVPKLRKLRVIIETGPGTTGTPSVKVWNLNSGLWDTASQVTTLTSLNGASKAFEVVMPGTACDMSGNSEYIDSGSSDAVDVEVTFTGTSSNVKLDMIQLIAVGARCCGDSNDDGVVSFADTTTTLARYGFTNSDVDGIIGDADDDGDVDFTDLTQIGALMNTTCR